MKNEKRTIKLIYHLRGGLSKNQCTIRVGRYSFSVVHNEYSGKIVFEGDMCHRQTQEKFEPSIFGDANFFACKPLFMGVNDLKPIVA